MNTVPAQFARDASTQLQMANFCHRDDSRTLARVASGKAPGAAAVAIHSDGLSDEYDLSLPPLFGSFDCNDNGIPDECECESFMMGGGDGGEGGGESAMLSGDDEGGEAATMSGDGDQSPDGNGGVGTDSEPDGAEADDTGDSPVPHDEDAAWEQYYEWAYGQCWGPSCETTGAEQFRAALQKKLELGLPPDRDW